MKELIDDLRYLMDTQKQWVKVHAAEYLLWSGHSENVKRVFLQEDVMYGHIPKYRIGIWRILAQAEIKMEKRAEWVQKILAVFHDLSALDRLHAIESLAKLKIAVPDSRDVFKDDLSDDCLDSFDLYTMWNAAYHPTIGEDAVRSRILKSLERAYKTDQGTALMVSAYILRYLGTMQNDDWQRLIQIAVIGHSDPVIHAAVLSTAWIVVGNEIHADELEHLKSMLFLLSDGKDALPHLFAALAVKGERSEWAFATDLYADAKGGETYPYDPDIHAGAAYMLLSMHGRCIEE